ncbi:MAG TPA: hypothetical protein VGR25_01135 [bacterium]|jgi:hypothetical protein|nr:hypothetical protein [bacterium]
MSQTVAIILKVGEEHTQTFEQMFADEILPLWREFVSAGKFLSASLTPVQDGDYPPPQGFRYYILHLEPRGMAEHEEFDQDPRFLKTFLPRAQALQPERPWVWFGDTLFKIEA